MLAEAGLEAWIKTSGNRGIHVFCPIEPTHEFLDVRHAVIAAARELERRMPEQVTTNWWKEERGERIFVDFNQANRDRTMAGAYSPRALPTATVATPVTWEELDAVRSRRPSRCERCPQRLAEIGDPWADVRGEAGTDRHAPAVVGARPGCRARRAAVPSGVPQDAGRAAARAAEPGAQARDWTAARAGQTSTAADVERRHGLELVVRARASARGRDASARTARCGGTGQPSSWS